jgi:(p)ppGpp synthase/HD superfamily hydrolase
MKDYLDIIKIVPEKDSSIVQMAWMMANFYFKGITDRAGKPYIEHLERVTYNALKEKNTKEVAVVGLLHDLFEDIEYIDRDNIKSIYGQDIYNSILAITKIPNENYDMYLKRVKENETSRIVKKHDLNDNMNLDRLPKVEDSDLQRLEKYKNAYIYIQ